MRARRLGLGATVALLGGIDAIAGGAGAVAAHLGKRCEAVLGVAAGNDRLDLGTPDRPSPEARQAKRLLDKCFKFVLPSCSKVLCS